MDLNDSISVIRGIGPKTEKILQKKQLFLVKDLLAYYPLRYEQYHAIVPICEAREGQMATIEGSLKKLPQLYQGRNRNMIKCAIQDASGSIEAIWYHMPFLKNQLKMGIRYIFRGKVTRKRGTFFLQQPMILEKKQFYERSKQWQPVYSSLEGITDRQVAKWMKQILSEITWTETLPKKIKEKYQLVSYQMAQKAIHFPKDAVEWKAARKRLIFEEFFYFLLQLRIWREAEEQQIGKPICKECPYCEEIIQQLPYTLTPSQQAVWTEIQQDLESGRVLHRLLQGDVGSGKTILAILALVKVVSSGYQAAFMAPTEILAKQNYEAVKGLVKQRFRVALLVGSMKQKEKKECLIKLKKQEIDILVGTHALMQEQVEYANLALVITDEQHRFGVKQRVSFAQKGEQVHVLVMSATPIPRTLSLTLYGDLDVSTLKELPKERQPVQSCIISANQRKSAYRFIEKEIQKGRQAYIICPMIERQEGTELENVMDYTEKLKTIFPEQITIACLHGNMKMEERTAIMTDFLQNKIQLLVATTVVEVGVHVANATVILIENAERFGLSSLHQLRGRVGRGTQASYCIFVQQTNGELARKRLQILQQSQDGFWIAEQDLQLRGPGTFFGIQQSGEMKFQIADLFRDRSLLQLAQDAVATLSKAEVEQMKKKKMPYKNLQMDVKTSRVSF